MSGSVGESIGLSPVLEEDGEGVPLLWPWQTQPAEGCLTTLHSLCTERWELCYRPTTPETLVFTAHITITKLLVNVAPSEAGQTALGRVAFP